jgi:uncharacterized membrane protein
MYFGVELRMYSWALFFITLSFIYIYEILKKPNLKNWAILTVLTICSAYTHYFSAIASFSLYLTFLIYILYKKRELLKKWILSAVVAILAYLPWIPFAYMQFSRVNNDFWIEPISINTIISYVYYVLSPSKLVIAANELQKPTILGSLLLIGIVVLIVYYLKNKKENNFDFPVFGLISFILVPLIGIILSIALSPIFHPRYLVPILGIFWLAISILLTKVSMKKEIFIPIIILILAIGLIGTVNFINIQETDYATMINDYNSLNNNDIIGSGNVIFTDNLSTVVIVDYYFPKDFPLCFMDNIGENIKNALNDPGIKGKIDNGAKVYFIDGKGKSNYEDCVNSGLNLKNTNSNIGNYEIYEIIV